MRARIQTAILLLLFFASGAAALIYQVLWLKELGRLFGVTAYAAATTLAVFFLGLSVGGFVWGRRTTRMANPLRVYGLLELAIALSAALYFVILDLYHYLYSPLFEVFGQRPALFLVVKFVLADGILFLPAFFMGGTLPVMGGYMIRRAGELGLKASLLYGINTIGAAVGAFAAGFYLPVALGFRKSYLVAMALNLLIGLVALVWSRSTSPSPAVFRDEQVTVEPSIPPRAGIGPGVVWTTAVVSGFVTLGLEVLWVRMFAQVLQNSVYTFAAILTIFLLALALGSAFANLLCRLSWPPMTVLFGLLTLSGLLVGLTPLVFYRLTAGLAYLGGDLEWSGYIVTVFAHIAVVLLIPGTVIGSVFPYLMKLSEEWSTSAGKTIGQIAAVNTAAAILGSVAAGFFLLDWIGLWASLRLMAIVYLVLAVVVLPGGLKSRPLLRALPLVGILLFTVVLTYSDFASVHVESAANEKVLETWEGSHGTVAVVSQGDNLRMKLNNYYTLGGSEAALLHRRHSLLPLTIHPDPKTVFLLGMGTGITAGGALDHPVDRIVVSELSPAMITAARTHFEPYLNGLFTDPRVEILIEDGRNHLYGTDRSYDVIIGDIFNSWKAGVGSLYTVEHFERVRARLAPGGIFAQWLPLAQLSRQELGIITRTILEVFPQVTVWRRGFSVETPVIALVGQDQSFPLDNRAFARNLQMLEAAGKISGNTWLGRIPNAAYAGNLSAAAGLFADNPLNTDDRPLFEYLAPISNRDAYAEGVSSFVGFELAELYADLFEILPPRDDPYLAGLSDTESDHVLAGLELYNYLISQRAGRAERATIHLREFQRLSGIDTLIRD
jgi:spermidine synthase